MTLFAFHIILGRRSKLYEDVVYAVSFNMGLKTGVFNQTWDAV
jgi:hypothetical protein